MDINFHLFSDYILITVWLIIFCIFILQYLPLEAQVSSYRTTAFSVVHNIHCWMYSLVHSIVGWTDRISEYLVISYFHSHSNNHFSQKQVDFYQVWEHKDSLW